MYFFEQIIHFIFIFFFLGESQDAAKDVPGELGQEVTEWGGGSHVAIFPIHETIHDRFSCRSTCCGFLVYCGGTNIYLL